MLELAFSHRFLRGTWQASVFGYEQSKLVQTVPNSAAPTLLAFANRPSKDRSWGSQITGKYQFSARWSIQSHYTYQRHTVASDVDPNIPQAPHHQFYSELQWQIGSAWNAGLRGLYVAGRGRAVNDPRPDPRNYVSAGFSIERRNILDRIDVRLFGDNIFNTAYAYPSDSSTFLPYDIPAPGRNWWLSVVVHL